MDGGSGRTRGRDSLRRPLGAGLGGDGRIPCDADALLGRPAVAGVRGAGTSGVPRCRPLGGLDNTGVAKADSVGAAGDVGAAAADAAVGDSAAPGLPAASDAADELPVRAR